MIHHLRTMDRRKLIAEFAVALAGVAGIYALWLIAWAATLPKILQ